LPVKRWEGSDDTDKIESEFEDGIKGKTTPDESARMGEKIGECFTL
jgi:hypothetical protein